jgi:predicted CoA-binding protein
MLAASLQLKEAAIECAGKQRGRVRRAYCFSGAHVSYLNKREGGRASNLQVEGDAGGGVARDANESDWRENLVTTDDGLRELLAETRRVAVLGIKTERQSYQPAFYVPQYLVNAGLEVVPVPVYYPEVTEIMGLKVYRKLGDVPGAIDMVNVFRRSEDIPPHVEDILAAKPKSVWFQSGIRNDRAAEQLARAGIKVVQDLCLMVEHRALGRRR